jgi:hypothetical protein
MKAALVMSLAVFTIGCQEATAPQSPTFELLQPSCSSPAPVLGQFDPDAPGFIVVFEHGVDAAQETPRLASQYRFTPRFIYTHALQGFSAQFTPSALAAVRCESSVDYAQFNARMTLN